LLRAAGVMCIGKYIDKYATGKENKTKKKLKIRDELELGWPRADAGRGEEGEE